MFDLTGNYLCLSAIQMAAALLLDRLLGEVTRFHPLVGFGNIAKALERCFNPQYFVKVEQPPQWQSHLKGCVCWFILVIPLPLLLFCLKSNQLGWLVLETLVLYFAVGLTSLKQHGLQIYQPLRKGDLNSARHFTGYMVSRDTTELSSDDMSRATVESVLENGHDAVIASLFYFVIGGAPLVVLHRLTNTLDAMWGYKTPRFLHFGWWSARADDHLGRLSAYCTTLLYAVQSMSLKKACDLIRLAGRQSRLYKSRNGGLCMASGAALLGFSLGGKSSYAGKIIHSPLLGAGRKVEINDIPRSLQVVSFSAYVLCTVVFTFGFVQLMGNR